MEDMFGGNPQTLSRTLTWMYVLEQNGSNVDWIVADDIAVMEELLIEINKLLEDPEFAKANEKLPLDLEVEKLESEYGALFGRTTGDALERFKVIFIACFIMAVPSGKVLGEFIAALEADKETWSNAINLIGALLVNGTEVSTHDSSMRKNYYTKV
jgi:hypothetical protein